jgi:cell division protein FtsW
MLYSPNAPRAELDLSLFWSVVLLLAIGLVMVYSASIAMAEAEKLSSYRSHYFLFRHAVYVGAGVFAAFVAFQIPIASWQRAAPWLFVGGALLLVLVLIPVIGRNVNGSRRWAL